MSRKKERKLTRWHFNLSSDDDDHERLREYLDALANDDKASQWIRDTLIAALPKAGSPPTVNTAQLRPPQRATAATPAKPLIVSNRVPYIPQKPSKPTVAPFDDEPRYVSDGDET